MNEGPRKGTRDEPVQESCDQRPAHVAIIVGITAIGYDSRRDCCESGSKVVPYDGEAESRVYEGRLASTFRRIDHQPIASSQIPNGELPDDHQDIRQLPLTGREIVHEQLARDI